MSVTLRELADLVGARVAGEADREVARVAPLAEATADAVAFCADERYLPELRQTRAGAVLLREEHAEACPVTALVADDPYYAYAAVAQRLHPPQRPADGVHPAAAVAGDAELGAGASVAAQAVVAAGAVLGEGVVVEPGAYIGPGARVGAGSWLGANAVLGAACILGERVIIQPGAVVGADGFGYAPGPAGAGWRKVPQLGAVRIGDDVEIGANATVDRGAQRDTVIEAGVKLDSHVHIAHNCRVGERTVIAGGTVLGGSARLGAGCMIGGQAAITDHIEIADGVTLMGMTGVTGSIHEAGAAYGSPLPAQPARRWRRNTVRVTQLDSLFQRVRRLEAAVARPGEAEDSEAGP